MSCARMYLRNLKNSCIIAEAWALRKIPTMATLLACSKAAWRRMDSTQHLISSGTRIDLCSKRKLSRNRCSTLLRRSQPVQRPKMQPINEILSPIISDIKNKKESWKIRVNKLWRCLHYLSQSLNLWIIEIILKYKLEYSVLNTIIYYYVNVANFTHHIEQLPNSSISHLLKTLNYYQI